nr:cytochrome P450 720B33 [Ginkgo biloba]
MAENALLLLLGGIIAIAFTFTVLQFYRGLKKNDEESKLPPGSMGWPLIGETISWYLCMSNNLPQKFVQERERRYGGIFSSHLFGRRTIVSVDPDFNKFLLQNEGRFFRARYPKPVVELQGKYALLSVHGDLQRKLHGIAVNLLSAEKLKVDFMDDIQTLLHNTLTTWEGQGNLLLQEECSEMILSLMAKQLLDLSSTKEIKEIRARYSDFSAALLSLPIKFPGTTYARGHKARNYLINKIHKTMEERRKHPQIVHNDLLTKLMAEESLSDEVVADFLLFFIFAGHETSSRSMAFAIKFLSECPKALEQLREEHDSIKKRRGNEKLTWDDYMSMNFTQCVINETLRLSNLSPGVFRETTESVKVKGYVIPKGFVVLGLIAGVHLNGKYHPAALVFDPWRWQKNEQDISKDQLFTPFGGGARLCPGLTLARLEVSLFLHQFVTRFGWKVLKEDHISHFPFPHFVEGFPIQLHCRE